MRAKDKAAQTKRESLRRAIAKWNATPVIYTEAGPFVRTRVGLIPVALKRCGQDRRTAKKARTK